MKLVSHERKADGSDDYETPDLLYSQLRKVFRFSRDVAANKKNRRCELFYGPGSEYGEDALTENWGHNVCWCNPPFSMWPLFAAKSLLESQYGATTVFLCPPRSDTEAYHGILSQADEHIMLAGRVQFTLNGKRPQMLDKKTGKMKDSSNGAASALYVFRPRIPGAVYGNPRLIFWDWRK